MKTPATARAKESVLAENKPVLAENKPPGGEHRKQPHDDYNYNYEYRDPFPSDRNLIRPAAFVFVCGALVLAIVAIIFLATA